MGNLIKKIGVTAISFLTALVKIHLSPNINVWNKFFKGKVSYWGTERLKESLEVRMSALALNLYLHLFIKA